MLVSRHNGTADPLVMSRVIANSLLKDLKGTKPAYVRLGVENVFRLLEMYRLDAFDAREPAGILETGAFPDPTILSELDNFSRLKVAMKSTQDAFLPGSSVIEFTQKVSDVFQPLIDPATPRHAENLAAAERFLAVLVTSLSNA